MWFWAIPVFGLIILVHEAGHFLVAKWSGIRVHEFAIGFGPPIASVKLGETRYSLRLFLVLGGFVRMAGMDESEMDDERGYLRKPVSARFATIAAGPLMNFLLAAVLFALVNAQVGVVRDPLVGGVLEGSPAAAAGLMSGDRVIKAAGQPIATWEQLVRQIQKHPNKPLDLVVVRQDSELALTVVPAENQGIGFLGIDAGTVKIGVFEAVWLGFSQTMRFIGALLVGIWWMITGQVAAELAGPVGITGMISEAGQAGWAHLARLAALISVNVGLLNLLPFPVLDGSRLVFLGVEALRGRALPPNQENLVHFFGFVVLISLLIWITMSEVVRYFM